MGEVWKIGKIGATVKNGVSGEIVAIVGSVRSTRVAPGGGETADGATKFNG